MHDPTEGGLYAALWELAQASQHSLWIDLEHIPDPALLLNVFARHLKLDPFGAIASGALLIAVSPDKKQQVVDTIRQEGTECTEIGVVCSEPGNPSVWTGTHPDTQLLPRPMQDEIAKLY